MYTTLVKLLREKIFTTEMIFRCDRTFTVRSKKKKKTNRHPAKSFSLFLIVVCPKCMKGKERFVPATLIAALGCYVNRCACMVSNLMNVFQYLDESSVVLNL